MDGLTRALQGGHCISRICLAKLKQLNRKDLEDRKEQSLCGLNSSSIALFGARFTDC
jgi:hypothetical protein